MNKLYKFLIAGIFTIICLFASFGNSVYISPGYNRYSNKVPAGNSSTFNVSIYPYSSANFEISGVGKQYLECYYGSGLFFTGDNTFYNNSSETIVFNFTCYNNGPKDYWPQITEFGSNNPNDFSTCDYTEYETIINSLSGNLVNCNSNLATATGNLATCQNNLSSCESDLSDCLGQSCDYTEYESQINSLSGSLNNCQNSLGASSTSLASCQNSLNSCLSANCPAVGVSRSSLFINDIQHLGASNIYMTIPEEFDWDYSYSNSGEIMEIDVDGYNVDYDYINNVVEIQKYKPSDEDFNNIIGILAQYMPIIVIFIGLLFLYKLLKKPFSSKKL